MHLNWSSTWLGSAVCWLLCVATGCSSSRRTDDAAPSEATETTQEAADGAPDEGAADAAAPDPDSGMLDTGLPDASISDEACEARQQAFAAFLEAHRDCERDEDCAVIGDCGPHADFASVQADAAARASELQLALCEEAYDGPVYDAVCRERRCELLERTDACCGCAFSDAG